MSDVPRLACSFPPSQDLPQRGAQAEALGYERVWVYDSPPLYGDVWVAVARVAEATDHIGVATGVAVGFLRHVMVTASAIATIEDLAPGRLTFAVGTGFTGARAMGRKAMKWADLGEYVAQLRALLHGDAVEVNGARCRMIHSPGYAPPRPIDVPLLLAPMGPKGFAYHAGAGRRRDRGLAPGHRRVGPVRALVQRHRARRGRGPHLATGGGDARAVVRDRRARPLGVRP